MKMKATLTAILTAGSMGWCVLTSNASVTPTPATAALPGHILYHVARAGDVQSFWRADGSSVVQLTGWGDYCCLHRVSPDHRRLLVMPGNDSLVGSPATGGTLAVRDLAYARLPLVDPTLNLIPQAWSPSGGRIAFEGWDDGDPSRTGVYTARVSDGGGLTRVTSYPGVPHDIPLDYSPDGRQLVFYRCVNPDPGPLDIGGSLWVVDVDGTHAHPITGDASRPAPWARWSPDGHRILFASERLSPTGAIWTVEPDGTDLTKLFEDPAGRFPVGPDWSPDGRHIVVALNPINNAYLHPHNGLYVLDDHGGNLRLLVGTDDFKTDPEWYA
jgi:Tol biopolymer transport system component